MLSALILMPPVAGETPTPLGALVRTLAALVPATVEGLVRDVTVIATGADDGVRRVAEHAGCGLIEDASFEAALCKAIAAARSPMLFLLRAGAFLDREFIDEVSRHLATEDLGASAPSLLLRAAPDGLVTRVLPDLAAVAGLIAARSKLAGTAKDFDALVRRVGATKTLTARASMAR